MPRAKKTKTETKAVQLKKKFEYHKENRSSLSIEELNALGVQGWELVQTLKDKSDRTFIFKREL